MKQNKKNLLEQWHEYIIEGGCDTFEIWKKKRHKKYPLKSPVIFYGYNNAKG